MGQKIDLYPYDAERLYNKPQPIQSLHTARRVRLDQLSFSLP